MYIGCGELLLFSCKMCCTVVVQLHGVLHCCCTVARCVALLLYSCTVCCTVVFQLHGVLHCCCSVARCVALLLFLDCTVCCAVVVQLHGVLHCCCSVARCVALLLFSCTVCCTVAGEGVSARTPADWDPSSDRAHQNFADKDIHRKLRSLLIG